MSEAFYRWVQDAPPDNLLWLAAYPQSGVTLARIILWHCFGLKTGSLYEEASLGPAYVGVIGAVTEIDDARRAADSQQWLPVKTHKLPWCVHDRKTVMVVRDGRTLLRSLQEFYPALAGRWHSMGDLIRGDHPWRDWSRWIRAWRREPRDVLWLRYEDLLSDLDKQLDRLAEHLGMEPVARKIPEFGTFHAVNPWMFRRGQAVAAMKPEDEALFWKHHGETMQALGYGAKDQGVGK